jgi:hypothetical protein
MSDLMDYLREEHKHYQHIEPDFDKWHAEIEQLRLSDQETQDTMISTRTSLTAMVGCFVVGAIIVIAMFVNLNW